MSTHAAPLPADAWAPVPMLWSKVVAGDVVLDPTGRPWMVTCTNALGRGIVTIRSGEDSISSVRNPDQTVNVLVALVERESVATLRAELGRVTVGERRVG